MIRIGGPALPVGNPADVGYLPGMAQLAVTMPPALQNWVDTRLAEGDYADAGDYVRDLVRRDRDLVEQDTRFLRAMVEEGLASGIVDAEPEDVLREIMARLPDA